GRIPAAGRVSGSSQNTENWEFVVVSDKEALSQTVYAPSNVLGAQLVVAIAGTAKQFDMARAAQNMLLAAWNDGVGSCPNGISDAEAAGRIGRARGGNGLAFGYPG